MKWQTAEWHTGMPVILVKEDGKVIQRLPLLPVKDAK